MSAEESASAIGADGCVGEGGSVSFECILSAIMDIRNGNLGLITIRKLLKQVDNALSTVAGDEADMSISGFGSTDILALCDEVESFCKPEQVSAIGTSPGLSSRLMALLKAALNQAV